MTHVWRAALIAVTQVIFLIVNVNGQGPLEEQIVKAVEVPPSPDAGHLGTYGDFSVNMATGSADISIPVLTLEENGIKIPITLSYQSAGLRVDERPSWVGMGWVLSAGGVISRTMRGRWDDMSGGFLRNVASIPAKGKVYNSLLPTASATIRDGVYTELDNLSKGEQVDYEPDAFTFNFGGQGGSFFFGNDGNVHTVEHSSLKFEPIFGSVPDVTTLNIIIGWTVTDNEGLVYTFKAFELSSARFSDRIISDYISSWYITSIYNQATKTQANFTYDQTEYSYNYDGTTNSYSYQRVTPNIHWTGPVYSTVSQEISHDKVKFLSSITLNDHTVEFNTSATTELFRQLNTIHWDNGPFSKDFLFEYEFFESDCEDPYQVGGCKRNKLKSFTELHPSNPKVYSFDYYPGVVPEITSKAQDHWGFYNGAYNSSLVPTVPYPGIATGVGGGANRNPSYSHMLIGMLKSITYPTKGSTTFYYEQNTWEDEIQAVEVTEDLGTMTVTGLYNLDPVCASKTIDATDFDIEYSLRYTYDPTFTGEPAGTYYPFIKIFEVAEEGFTELLETHVMNYPNSDAVSKVTVLPAGSTYRLDVCAYDGQQVFVSDLELVKVDQTGIGLPIARPTGGLRLSRTENRDSESANVNIRTFDYGYGGYFVNPELNWNNGVPSYTSNSIFETIEVYGGEQYTTTTLTVSASPVLGLSSSTVPVAYKKVNEWLGTKDLNIGRIETIYMESLDQVAGLVPQVSRHSARTKVDIQNYYDASGNLLKSEDYDYDELNVGSVLGFRAKRRKSGTLKDYANDFGCENYSLYSTWFPIVSKETLLNTPAGNVTTTTFYEYDPTLVHTNPVHEKVLNSKGEEIDRVYSYAIDKTTCEKECYTNYRQELNTCAALMTSYATETSSSKAIYDGCYQQLLIDMAAYRQEVETECYINGAYSTLCAVEKRSEYNFDQDFNTCLNTNGYFTLLDGQGEYYEYEHCQKTAFVNYRLCQNNFSTCLLNEFETKIELSDKANALLGLGNWMSTPIEIKTFNESEELSKLTVNYGVSNEIPLKQSVLRTSQTSETYPLLTINSYDIKANPTELIDHKEGYSKVYLWNSDKTYLIAEVQNATFNEVGHTSFENESNEGNLEFMINKWTDGKTGNSSHLLAGNYIRKTDLISGNRYKVSYWAKSGVPVLEAGEVFSSTSGEAEPDGWIYYESIVSGPVITVNGSGLTLIDEFRIVPENSLITTFTHQPGIGLTSMTDANNQVSYYTYESSGKLEMIQDHYHNIIRLLKYHYKN